MSSPLLRRLFVSLPFQSIASVYRGLASMEKTVDVRNISVDELDCKLVLVFHCKHDDERETERERDKEKDRDKERHKGKRKKGIKRNME